MGTGFPIITPSSCPSVVSKKTESEIIISSVIQICAATKQMIGPGQFRIIPGMEENSLVGSTVD